MEKAFKELILALRSIGDALMGKINSSNNDEGGFLRNYNTVVGVKGIAAIYRNNNDSDSIGIEDIVEETPVFLFDKTKSLSENFKLFCSQNIDFTNHYFFSIENGGSTRYGIFAVYENNDNKNFYDFNSFKIGLIDMTEEYDFDDLLEFLSNENCEVRIICINTAMPSANFIPVDNKHYIIFFNDYLTLQSNNNDNPGDDDVSVGRSAKKSSSESEESFKSFINRLKENKEINKKEREEKNEERRKAFMEFLNKLKNAEEKEEEKETTEEIKEVKEVKEEVKESEKSSELETKQEETK